MYLAIRDRVRAATSNQPSLGHENTVSIMMRPLIPGLLSVSGGGRFRGLSTYFSDDHEGQWAAAGLLFAFFVISLGCYWVTRRVRWYPHLYIALQGGLALSLLLLPPHLGYFSILFFLLGAPGYVGSPNALAICGLASSPRPWRRRSSALQGRDGLPLILLYEVQAFTSSLPSQHWQPNLNLPEETFEEAHSQLQEYAAKAEELAVTQERNRVARDLHDSLHSVHI